jgi:hypothetical protein
MRHKLRAVSVCNLKQAHNTGKCRCWAELVNLLKANVKNIARERERGRER